MLKKSVDRIFQICIMIIMNEKNQQQKGACMKRIRLHGNERIGFSNIYCAECNKAIIVEGNPMIPIYYAHEGFHYCPSCAHKIDNK
jgi:uncharacterized protein with PIN domain